MTRYLQRSWFSLVLFRTKCTTMPVQSPLGQVLCAQSSLPSQCFNVESEPDKCCSSAQRFCESVMIRKNSLVSDISMPPGISLSQLVVKFKLDGHNGRRRDSASKCQQNKPSLYQFADRAPQGPSDPSDPSGHEWSVRWPTACGVCSWQKCASAGLATLR